MALASNSVIGLDTREGVMSKAACEIELEHIVNIKEGGVVTVDKGRLLQEALVEWEKQLKLLEGKEEKWDKRINQATKEIYQLVGVYIVFVGLVYTGVLQSSALKCHHIWSPIILCVLAYLVILIVTAKKFRLIFRARVTRREDSLSRQQVAGYLRNLKAEGVNFSFLDSEKKSGLRFPTERAENNRIPVFSFITVLTLALVGSFAHIKCVP